ncbi:hypothetical protein ACXR0O_19165 [Verrucomicrobiota bacterium sgz303538]
MPAALDMLKRGVALIARAFGTTAYTIEGIARPDGKPFEGFFTELGTTETLEINGRRVSFSVLVATPREQFPGGTPPKQGLLVTRTSDGAVFRISGEVQADQLTIRFGLDNRHK